MLIRNGSVRLIAAVGTMRMVSRHKSNYQLISAVCLERLPLLSPELNLLERSMQRAFRDHETVRSLYSDHELRHFEDLKRAARMAANTHDEKDIENASKQTSADFEDASNAELQSFRFTDRLTEADSKNDKQSLSRCLDRRLLLVTKSKMGERFQWLLPETKVEPGETLRQAAERALSATLGQQDHLHLKFFGNAPASVYSYRYPKAVQKSSNANGAHIFIFKAQLNPNASIDASKIDKNITTDHNWLTRSEFEELMTAERQRRYWAAIDRSLLFEGVDKNFVARVLNRLRSRIVSDQDVRETVTLK